MGKLFFQRDTKYQNLKGIEEFDYMRFKLLHHLTSNRSTIFTICVTSVGLYVEYMSKTKPLSLRSKWAKFMNRQRAEEIQMVGKLMKRRLTSLVVTVFCCSMTSHPQI